MGNNLLIRSAILNDSAQISNLVDTAHFIHRHLDWHSPVQWIGHPPFYVIERNRHIHAALACPPDPTGVSWIRLFVSSLEMHPEVTWHDLFPIVIDELKQMKVNMLVAIVIQDWFEKILQNHGFTHIQDVVVLRHDNSLIGDFKTWNSQLGTPPKGIFQPSLLSITLRFLLSGKCLKMHSP